MRKLTFGFIVPAEFTMEVSEKEYEAMAAHNERRTEADAVMNKAKHLAMRNMADVKLAVFNLHREDISYVYDDKNNVMYEY